MLTTVAFLLKILKKGLETEAGDSVRALWLAHASKDDNFSLQSL